MVWGILGTSPFADKTIFQVAEQVYDYIRAQWTLTGALAVGSFDDDNRPNPNRQYWIWVRHAGLRSDRGSINSLFNYIHKFAIYAYAKRSKPSPSDFPELGSMIAEIQRILWSYQEHAAPGILYFDGMEMGDIAEVSNKGAAWARTWEVVTVINAFYQKTNQ